MSLSSVRAFLAERAPDIEVLEAATSTATVALAAAAHGVEPAQIAKTLSLRLGGDVILIVMGGEARLDNRKYKDRFAAKAKMLDAAEVLEATSHPVGGVCPFGLPRPLRIYADLSLRLNGDPILLVMGGEARLDNRKYKDRFGAKAKMLDADEVLAATSHPVGGVCPFGLPRALPIYADVSLRQFDVVVPAAGDTHHALRIGTDRLVQLAGAEWIDVAQAPAATAP